MNQKSITADCQNCESTFGVDYMEELVSQFMSTLMSARTQAHVFHLGTKGPGSFAAHKALNEFYDDSVDNIHEINTKLRKQQSMPIELFLVKPKV